MRDYPYERYAKIRDFRGLTDYKVTKLTGIKGTATISNWKNGKYTPKDDKMQDIADALEVDKDYLTGESDQTECKECGYKYDILDSFDRAIHDQFHSKIIKAKEQYSCLLPYKELAGIRSNSLIKIRNDSDDIATELNKYLKAEFSYYVYSNYEPSKNFDFSEFSKTLVMEMINSGEIPQDRINDVVKWYNLDIGFVDVQGAMLARASKNPQLMRLLAYAEKLNPETLNMLQIQAKALSEQSKNKE